MVKGIGVDLVDLDRIKEIIEKRPSFVERVLTPAEYQAFNRLKGKRQIEFLGGRFACKEAYMKAVGTGIGALSFQDIEVLNLDSGQPVVKVVTAPSEDQILVSISHTDSMAMAQIVIA